MSRSTSPQAEEIFLAASELAASERDRLLESACAGDADLRAEVQSLLDAAEASGRYFEGLPGRLGIDKLRSEAPRPNHHAKQGQQFGKYRLTSLLGTGGMGEVWRADRSDGRFEVEVAVKVLTRLGSRSALKQFDREASYLAKLTHANIARLIDAGVGPDDVPYLILEYVDGKAIDEYCDAGALSIDRRLRLFIAVLEAVAHAHARLVVHSDIKPSNVLVTPEGSVKLLDFGIATLLTAVEVPGTSAGLTPEYAAPEQLAGSGITTATDVYSLGLLLYLLLAGSNPRQVSDVSSLVELQEMVNQSPPSLASTVSGTADVDNEDLERLAAERGASPGKFVKTLRGELDQIVSKALAVDPADRYLTVADFAADLRRYLRDQPVSAVSDSVGYRARKFMQRHRGGVLTAILTLISLTAAALITTWQSIEARRQRDAAIRGQERALATNDLLNRLLGELGPRGEKMSLQELVDRGVEIVDQQYGTNERTTAMSYYDLSVLYGRLGQVETQISLLDRTESIGRNIGDDGLIARALCAKARLKLEGDAAGSSADLAAGLLIRDRMPRRQSNRNIDCYRAEGFLLSAAKNHDGAIAVYQRAIDVIDEANVSSEALRMTLLNDLAEQYYITDRPAGALGILEEIISGSERLGRERSVNHVIFLANRGAILSRLGEVRRAFDAQRDVFERVQSMERPPVGISQHYASSLSRLARYDEALQLYQADYERAQAGGNKRWQGQIAMGMARVMVKLDRLDEAQANLTIAEGVFQESPGAYAREVITTSLIEARLLLARGDSAGARQAAAIILAELGYPTEKNAPGLSAALWTAAQIALATDDSEAALEYSSDQLDLALAIARDPAMSADVGQAYHQRGLARLALGDEAGAMDDLQRAALALSNGFGEDHPEAVEARASLNR